VLAGQVGGVKQVYGWLYTPLIELMSISTLAAICSSTTKYLVAKPKQSTDAIGNQLKHDIAKIQAAIL
jgi:hypothetical protein